MEGGGEGSFAWRPMEGEGEGSFAWRPMEGEGSFAWRLMEGEEEGSFSPLPTSPQAILLRLSYFSFDIKVLFYHGSRLLFTHFLPFPWPINYDHAF